MIFLDISGNVAHEQLGVTTLLTILIISIIMTMVVVVSGDSVLQDNNRSDIQNLHRDHLCDRRANKLEWT
jgi:hypothetical protein